VADEPSGSNDDSFGEGSKEDSPVPSVVAGSIPPQKSDLLSFGLYVEADGADRFLHVYWLRVQELRADQHGLRFSRAHHVSERGHAGCTSGDFRSVRSRAGRHQSKLFLSLWTAPKTRRPPERL
jgi:hypothetical protein